MATNPVQLTMTVLSLILRLIQSLLNNMLGDGKTTVLMNGMALYLRADA